MEYSDRLNITVTVDEEHQHSYGDEWKYDGESHWHECDCGAVSDRAAHDMEVRNAKEATETEAGYTGDKVCKVCGYTVTGREIIATGGTSNPEKPDENPSNPGTGGNSETGSNGNEGGSPSTGDNSSLALCSPYCLYPAVASLERWFGTGGKTAE